jgi:hypothetical protein
MPPGQPRVSGLCSGPAAHFSVDHNCLSLTPSAFPVCPVMRKMVCLMHGLIQNPNFSLAQ